MQFTVKTTSGNLVDFVSSAPVSLRLILWKVTSAPPRIPRTRMAPRRINLGNRMQSARAQCRGPLFSVLTDQYSAPLWMMRAAAVSRGSFTKLALFCHLPPLGPGSGEKACSQRL